MYVYSMGMVHTQGKQAKKVPILFTNEMLKVGDLLYRLRDDCGCPKTNRYFFASCGDGHIKFHKVLSATLKDINNLEHAEWISATSMRKYIATTIQVTFST